jgi:hypothetical protein
LPAATFWLDHAGLNLAFVSILSALVLFAHRWNLVDEIPALAARFGVTAQPEQPKL